MTLPQPTAAALGAWLEARGDRPGPLLHRLDGPAPGRLSGESLRRIVRRLGEAAGLARPLRPHGLRHSAATSALDAGRDVREVRKFTRHRSLEMVLKYDDPRRDVAGEIAKDLAGRRDDGRDVSTARSGKGSGKAGRLLETSRRRPPAFDVSVDTATGRNSFPRSEAVIF